MRNTKGIIKTRQRNGSEPRIDRVIKQAINKIIFKSTRTIKGYLGTAKSKRALSTSSGLYRIPWSYSHV